MSDSDAKPFSLHQFSIRRKSTQINLSILLIFLLTILGIILTINSFSSIEDATENVGGGLGQSDTAVSSPEGTATGAAQAISEARTRLLIVGGLTLAVATFLFYRLISVGVRSVALELWIRRLGEGDMDHKVEMQGNDEITELARSLEELRQRSIRALQLDMVQKLSQELLEKNDELEQVLADLRKTQDQIVMQQKLAELGELSAGVAHEIRNPLNFVKNFSEVSQELLKEMRETLEAGDEADIEQLRLMTEITGELTENMDRILQHVERANRVVQDMDFLGRNGGQLQTVNINTILQEWAQLAYNNVRNNDPEFRMEIIEELDPKAGELSAIPQDLGRVFLNIIINSCYATDEKRQAFKEKGQPYTPTLWLKTERTDEEIRVKIRDNGPGIAPDVMEKIFTPFFTTKPSDRATGLGLSLSSDIIRSYGGSIIPASEPGEYTEMLISLPASRP